MNGILVLAAGDPGIPDVVSTSGVIALLVSFVIAILRGWVLLPRELDACRTALEQQKDINAALERDRDEWRSIARGTTDPLQTMARTLREGS